MIVERIETANLPAATYRTARRLLDVADQRTGAARLTHERMREIVGTNADATVRRHLVELQGAGIIAYRRNSDVQIWFADWQAYNVAKESDQPRSAVISGDQHTRTVISSDQYTRESEHGSVISGDQHTRKVISTRANRAHTDHLPHTHAGARSDRLTDPLSNNEISQSVTPGPEEQAQSLAMLRTVKVSTELATQIAAAHPFERVRYCIGAWWMNRKVNGGRLENERPGVVVHWLREWPRVEPNPYDERAWQREALYLAHRTPDELAADAAHEEPPALPPPVVAHSPPRQYLDSDPAWRAVAADAYAASELAGLVEVGDAEGIPLYKLAAKDHTRSQYLENRLAAKLRRIITGATGKPAQVEIIGDECAT